MRTPSAGFNPRPPRKVGATLRVSEESHSPICFNPRPPRKVGATTAKARTRPQLNVSILAHPERWALPQENETYPVILVFQSSPTPKGGRYHRRISSRSSFSSFNPRPPRKVGATLQRFAYHRPAPVSILAHPERWALRWCARQASSRRPVSILAHPERWALPVHLATRRINQKFQSSPTPERWALRDRESLIDCVPAGFNPRPPRKVGATRADSVLDEAAEGFNPRPPRKVGATGDDAPGWRVRKVSILAHPERWALRHDTRPWHPPFPVSILAHPERWALRAAKIEIAALARVFQSSPTPKGGRYGRAG